MAAMKARDVVGRRIVGLDQYLRRDERTGETDWVVRALYLDNGTRLLTHGYETETEPEGTLLLWRPPAP